MICIKKSTQNIGVKLIRFSTSTLWVLLKLKFLPRFLPCFQQNNQIMLHIGYTINFSTKSIKLFVWNFSFSACFTAFITEEVLIPCSIKTNVIWNHDLWIKSHFKRSWLSKFAFSIPKGLLFAIIQLQIWISFISFRNNKVATVTEREGTRKAEIWLYKSCWCCAALPLLYENLNKFRQRFKKREITFFRPNFRNTREELFFCSRFSRRAFFLSNEKWVKHLEEYIEDCRF